MDFNNTHEDWKKEAPILAAIEKKNPFTIPENYFESLHADIVAEKLKGTVSNDGFTLPNNYFEQLQANIHATISKEKTAEKYHIIKKLNYTWIKYAAAACVTIAVSVAVFINTRKNAIESQLHAIPETEIVQYLQLNTDASDTPVIIENLSSNSEFLDLNTDVSQEEIEQYINSTTL